MIPIELQMVGFPPSLIDFLLKGPLTEPLELPFTSPLMAGRAKRGLYNLLRQVPAKPFKISQPNPCTLVLKPALSKKFPSADLPKCGGYRYMPGQVKEEEDYIELISTEHEVIQDEGHEQISLKKYGPTDPEGLEGDGDKTNLK